MIDPERLLARFLRYVQIDTTAREEAGQYPSSPGQLELGKILVDELHSLGLSDASQSKFGIVAATVPATVENGTPTIAFNAHVDTSPETTGAGVKPGVSHGVTDGLGQKAVQDIHPLYDFNATILHLLGLDHERLSFYHNGIERRLTDVHGKVIEGVVA